MQAFDSHKALDKLEELIKGLAKKNTLSSHLAEIKNITDYLESIYEQGLREGFELSEKADKLKL